MKEELKKKKKLQEFAKAAGAGGIKEAVSDDTKKKIGNAISKVAKDTVKTVAPMIAEPKAGSIVKDTLKKIKESKEKDVKSINQKKEAYNNFQNLSKEDKIKTIKENVKKNTTPGGKGFNEANFENQTAKRYEKVGVSPIYSKGKFDRSDKELDEKYGNRLTEDDKVTSKSKKRNKSQY